VSASVSGVAAVVAGPVDSVGAALVGVAVVGADDVVLLLPHAAAIAPARVNRATTRSAGRRVRGVANVDMIGRQYSRIPTNAIAFTDMWNVIPPVDKLRVIR